MTIKELPNKIPNVYHTKGGNYETERGDIWAAISSGDRGNDLEAWWVISEATDDNGTDFDQINRAN